jgi:hypothetical protein
MLYMRFEIDINLKGGKCTRNRVAALAVALAFDAGFLLHLLTAAFETKRT